MVICSSSVEEAVGEVSASKLGDGGDALTADRHGRRAARMKATAGRWIDEAWRLASGR